MIFLKAYVNYCAYVFISISYKLVINLVDKMPKKKQELKDKLQERQNGIGALFPIANPDFKG